MQGRVWGGLDGAEECDRKQQWGSMEECTWSQDEFRRSGLRVREEIHDR